MTQVRLSQVSKAYGKKITTNTPLAVDKVSFEVNSGEFFIMLGPSGCGKTSTLRMIAGLEDITAGEIYLDDKLVNKLTPGQRNLAMAFEAYALYPPLNVYENLAYGLRARRVPNREIDARVNEVAELLEMEATLRIHPRELSGGQQQLVSLARALVRGAPLLLLDEPLSHLEPARRFRVRTAVRDFTTKRKMTVIYVTHDQVEATALADRIAVMSVGHLQQVGTPTELWNTPTTKFVAGFIGEPSMNFLNLGAFHNRELLSTFKTANTNSSLAVNDETVVGVRPQDLRIVDEAQALNMAVVDGVISNMQWLGHESQLYCMVDSVPVITVLPPNVPMNFQADKPIRLGTQVEHMHLFDTDGMRVEQAQAGIELPSL